MDITQKLDDYIKRILDAGDSLDVLQAFMTGDESVKVILSSGESIPSLRGLVAVSINSLNKARTYVDNQNRELQERLLSLEKRLAQLERQ